MDKSSRKRKRSNGAKVFHQNGNEEKTETTAFTPPTTYDTRTITGALNTKQQSDIRAPYTLLFRDKIVVVTTLQQQEPTKTDSTLNGTTLEDSVDDSVDIDTNETMTIANTYKTVTSFLQQKLGAAITNQVHSRVYCVVASPQAIKEPTQRIRKAWKRNIPVMTTQYIYDCYHQQIIIPIPMISDIPNKYRILPPSPSQSSSKTKRTQILVNTNHEGDHSTTNLDVPERIMDLGCCCICHDNDDTTIGKRDPCEWCIDCSYTKKLQP